MTTLPRDNDNTPIPALRLNPNGAHQISATGTASRNATPFADDTRVISVYATDAVYIQCGDNAVTATTSDHYFPGGLYYDFAIGGDKVEHNPYVSVIAASGSASVYISEKQ